MHGRHRPLPTLGVISTGDAGFPGWLGFIRPGWKLKPVRRVSSLEEWFPVGAARVLRALLGRRGSPDVIDALAGVLHVRLNIPDSQGRLMKFLKNRIESIRIKNMEGKIYLIQCREYLKIGFSTDPEVRLQNLCPTKLPFEFRLIADRPGDYAFESFLHEKYADYREEGEWFLFSTSKVYEVIKEHGFERRAHFEPWHDADIALSRTVERFEKKLKRLQRDMDCAANAGRVEMLEFFRDLVCDTMLPAFDGKKGRLPAVSKLEVLKREDAA